MRLQIASDLHTEQHADDGKGLFEEMREANPDVLIIAGDFATSLGIGLPMSHLCRTYKGIPIVYVPGNHDYWGGTRGQLHSALRNLSRKNDNLHWLGFDSVIGPQARIAGLKFTGTTLWFPDDPINRFYEHPILARHPRSPTLARAMGQFADFHQIENLQTWVYQENEQARNLLQGEGGQADVIVTHHLPNAVFVPERFRASDINRFYVGDAYHPDCTARLWVFGHSHDSTDRVIGETRFIGNPFGYVKHGLNHAFRPKLVVEVEPRMTA